MKIKTLFIAFLALLLCSCANTKDDGNADTLRSGVLSAEHNSDTYRQVKRSLIATLEAEEITSADSDLSQYDILFIDKSMAGEDLSPVTNFVENGGFVFLDNALYDSFDADFIGAEEFVKVEKCPTELICPDENRDMLKTQELLCDFLRLYANYKNYDVLSEKDYGYGVIPSSAEEVAGFDGISLYTLNRYGNGFVFFTNPLLPNSFSVNDLSPEHEGEYFSNSTVGANILLQSCFAEFVSIQKYGYAVWRTFGSFGTKPSAWELHYEDMNGIENESAITFDKLCREYGQFPSYTLVRNPYTWFERAETVTYLTENNGSYEPYSYENAYSSGQHCVSMKKWLKIGKYDNTDSYFEYSGKYTLRAYPLPCDFDSDGKADLICGAGDGNLYFYSGIGKNENYKFGAPVYLTDTDGAPLNVGAYSSPTFADIDLDGIDELLSGSEDGKIYCFKHISGCMFEKQGVILETELEDSMISAGDLNGDGFDDLAVGSRKGDLRIYYGERSQYGIKFSEYATVDSKHSWTAPCITEDGRLYTGTGEGYIAEFKNIDESYEFSNYIDSEKYNYNGNKHLKFGENCTPCFYDLDGDGKTELICGELEYGTAYPIDSSYFPLREKLQKHIDYFEDNYIYVGVHSLTQKYADEDQEQDELEMHKKAFASYGLGWSGLGVNQHTWFTSQIGYDGDFDNETGYDGTYRHQYESGLLWNSGSQTPKSNAVPQISAENSLTVPFELSSGMLMLQPSNTPYGPKLFSDTSAKYEIPLLFYNHCDYIYKNEDNQEEQIQKVDKIVSENGYTFVGEDQLAKAVTAAYSTKVTAKRDGEKIIISAIPYDKHSKLYDDKYADCTGVKVVFAKEKDPLAYRSNASVWRIENHAVYVSLDKEAEIIPERTTHPHITAINIPADISENEKEIKIKFKDNGFMQVFAEGYTDTSSDGWETVTDGSKTIFRKYGKASELVIERR